MTDPAVKFSEIQKELEAAEATARDAEAQAALYENTDPRAVLLRAQAKEVRAAVQRVHIAVGAGLLRAAEKEPR